MKILTAKGNCVGWYELEGFVRKHNLGSGDKFGISWKVGKKRKLRRYRFGRMFIPIGDDRDYSSPWFEVFVRGKKNHGGRRIVVFGLDTAGETSNI
jgi:hypothetical protein